VQIQVSLPGLRDGPSAACEGGRVEHDEVEELSRCLERLQVVKDIGSLKGTTLQRIASGVLTRLLNCPRRDIDPRDRKGSCPRRRQGETPFVAETVQDGEPGGQRRDNLAVLALIEEESGLLALKSVHPVENAIETDLCRVHAPGQQPRAVCESLEIAERRFIPFDDRIWMQQFLEQSTQQGKPLIHPRGGGLDHQ